MRFLADESCDFAVVRALRAAGHDVTAVANIAPGSTDTDVVQMAHDQSRILVTEDKDFGQLFFASAPASPGVVLIRFPARARTKSSVTKRRIRWPTGSLGVTIHEPPVRGAR